MSKTVKKERKPTEVDLKTVRSTCAVVDYSVPKIRKALSCTWREASEIRRELLKLDKAKS